MKNNNVELSGRVAGEPKMSHITKWESFYLMEVDVMRRSGSLDRIPVMVSGHFPVELYKEGTYVKVNGSFRSRNNEGHLELFVFADNVEMLLNPLPSDLNTVTLHGFLCKPPQYRRTPLGREITDLTLAVNREVFNRSYYIPAIAWGRSARCLFEKPVGAELTVSGRIQSRKYVKTLEDGSQIEHTAYEMSINTFEMGGTEDV